MMFTALLLSLFHVNNNQHYCESFTTTAFINPSIHTNNPTITSTIPPKIYENFSRKHEYSKTWLLSTYSSEQQTTQKRRRRKSAVKSKVLLQRVLKDIHYPSLDAYLRSYQIPSSRLPMPYEQQGITEKQQDNTLKSWVTPLLPTTSSYKLTLEIIAIQLPLPTSSHNETLAKAAETVQENNLFVMPRMAMVVLKRHNPSTEEDDLKSLMTSSERQIVRSLETGLDNFCLRSNGAQQGDDEGGGVLTMEQVEEEENMLEAARIAAAEAEATKEAAKNELKQAKKTSTEKKEMWENKVEVLNEGSIREASTEILDAKNGIIDADVITKDLKSIALPKAGPPTETKNQKSQTNAKAIDAATKDDDISTTKVMAKDDKEETDKVKQSRPAVASRVEKQQTQPKVRIENKKEEPKSRNAASTKTLINSSEEDFDNIMESKSLEISDLELDEKSGDASQKNIEDGYYTNKELFDKVMEFGNEQSEKERAGVGFATAAFETAKEFLKNPNYQPTVKNQKEETRGTKKFMSAEDEEKKKEDKMSEEMRQQRELQRLFSAGQNVAESKIQTKPGSYSKLFENDEDIENEMDQLLENENMIRDAKRTMEDELTELELRIALNTDEFDEPIQIHTEEGDAFDIFDPTPYKSRIKEGEDLLLEANYPGALPINQKEVTSIHPNLKDAVNNANYAATMMSRIVEREMEDGSWQYFLGDDVIPTEEALEIQKCVINAVKIGLIDDPAIEIDERNQLAVLLNELRYCAGYDVYEQERFMEIVVGDDISGGYKGLLLSDNFITLVKERLQLIKQRDRDASINKTLTSEEKSVLQATHTLERTILTKLIQAATLLLKETRAAGAELEAEQLETIRNICRVAMDPNHATEQDAAFALSDTVRDMRPLLNEDFISYLSYAIAEEEGRLLRRGYLEDPEQNRWWMVLQIVQKGVYAELGRSLNRYTDHVFYVLRMKTRSERKELLRELINDLPSLDVRPFRKVVDNIVKSLGAVARGEWKDETDAEVMGGMTNVILQLGVDIEELLPPEKIAEKSKVADEWARRQREKIREAQEMRRDRLKKQREDSRGAGNEEGSVEETERRFERRRK